MRGPQARWKSEGPAICRGPGPAEQTEGVLPKAGRRRAPVRHRGGGRLQGAPAEAACSKATRRQCVRVGGHVSPPPGLPLAARWEMGAPFFSRRGLISPAGKWGGLVKT